MQAGFMSHFSNLPDPRIECCERHELMDILFLSISAVLCGAEGREDHKAFISTGGQEKRHPHGRCLGLLKRSGVGSAEG